MELKKIVLLPIPKFIIIWSSLLLRYLNEWRENAFRSISAFLIDYICDKPLMVDRVSSIGVLLPVSNSPMGSKMVFLQFKDIKCSVCVKIASVSKYGGSNSTDE